MTEKISQPQTELFPDLSFQDLEEKVNELKRLFLGAQIPKNKKIEIDKYSRALYHRKFQAKAFAIDFEKTNQEYLLFIVAGKDLYKLCDRSAIFFAMDIAPRIQEGANLMYDSDHRNKSKTGTVTKKVSSQLIGKLSAIKILEYSEIKYDGVKSDIICFKLPYKYSDEQIEEFAQRAVLQSIEFNKIAMPKNPVPNLYVSICEINNASLDLIGHISKDESLRAFIGPHLFEYSRQLFHNYLNMSCERTAYDQTLLTMKHNIIMLKNDLKLLDVIDRFKSKRSIYRVGNAIRETEKIIQRLLKKNKIARDRLKNSNNQKG